MSHEVEMLERHYTLPKDIEAINSLYRQLSEEPKVATRGSMKNAIVVTGVKLFIVRDVSSKRIVGMVSFFPIFDLSGLSGQVRDFVVDEAYRRRGIGRALMCNVVQTARCIQLGSIEFVSNSSHEAVHALCRSFGFTKRKKQIFALSL